MLNSIPNRLWAYTANVVGSLAGIVVFGLMSAFRTPPVVWYAISALLVFRFVRSWSAVADHLRGRADHHAGVCLVPRQYEAHDDLVALLQDLI